MAKPKESAMPSWPTFSPPSTAAPQPNRTRIRVPMNSARNFAILGLPGAAVRGLVAQPAPGRHPAKPRVLSIRQGEGPPGGMRRDEIRQALIALGARMRAVEGGGLGVPQPVGRERAEDVDEWDLEAGAEQLQVFVQRLDPRRAAGVRD